MKHNESETVKIWSDVTLIVLYNLILYTLKGLLCTNSPLVALVLLGEFETDLLAGEWFLWSGEFIWLQQGLLNYPRTSVCKVNPYEGKFGFLIGDGCY